MEQKTTQLSAARQLQYIPTPLEMPNIHVERCTILNPASLLPTAADEEEYDCIAAVHQKCTPRVDLSDVTLTDPELILFVDGSESRDPDTGRTVLNLLCAHKLLLLSAHLLHLTSLHKQLTSTEACQFAAGQSGTIYTDSRYAFGMAHDFGILCVTRVKIIVIFSIRGILFC